MEPFLAMILAWGGSFAPRGWATCSGQLLPISQNTALFSLLGTTFGGDGRTSFGLPDLRGRTPIGEGNGPGLQSYRWGQRGGRETVVLSAAEMPAHIHGAAFTGTGFVASVKIPAINNVESTTNVPSNSVNFAVGKVGVGFGAQDANTFAAGTVNTQIGSNIGITGTASGTVAVSSTGGSQSHENRMPFLVLYHIIALQGVFPSRS